MTIDTFSIFVYALLIACSSNASVFDIEMEIQKYKDEIAGEMTKKSILKSDLRIKESKKSKNMKKKDELLRELVVLHRMIEKNNLRISTLKSSINIINNDIERIDKDISDINYKIAACDSRITYLNNMIPVIKRTKSRLFTR